MLLETALLGTAEKLVQHLLKLDALLLVQGPPGQRKPRDRNVAHAGRKKRAVLALGEVGHPLILSWPFRQPTP